MLPYFNKRNVRYIGLTTLAVVAIFGPEVSFSPGSDSRALSAEDGGSRALQASKPPPPPGFDLQCGPGQEAFTLDWADVTLDFTKDVNTVTFPTGTTVTIKTSTTGGAILDQWRMWQNGDKSITTPVFGTKQLGEYCSLDPKFDPVYPDAVSNQIAVFCFAYWLVQRLNQVYRQLTLSSFSCTVCDDGDDFRYGVVGNVYLYR